MIRKIPLHAARWAATTFTLIAASVNVRAQSIGAPPAPGNTDVPVKEGVLFSSGVGYFQHEGTVHGDAATELRFKTSRINDILQSQQVSRREEYAASLADLDINRTCKMSWRTTGNRKLYERTACLPNPTATP